MNAPTFELERAFLSSAADILAARERAQIIHHTKDIDEAGEEVERAVRRAFRDKLPSQYHVGNGHIVDANLNTSPQIDILVVDSHGTPVLMRSESGAEYVPYESVYALGEVKSTYKRS